MVSFNILFITVILLVGVCQCSQYQRTVRYDYEIVIRCPVDGMKEFLARDDIDIWKITPDGTADVRINKKLLDDVVTMETVAKCTTIIPNVETFVQQFENSTNVNKDTKNEWFEAYHTFEEGVEWYKEICGGDDKCEYINSIGKSIEGRDQPAIHIGRGEHKIYFQCLIHAREWISGAVCMYITNYLVENYKEPRIQELLENVKFVIVPYVNPDGYAYSWSNDRLWRKNRRDNPGSTCRGVDLNRNYNDHWNEGGSSNNPCSETYHGSEPASEPETQNTQNHFKDNAPIIGAIDWHSYSQLILRPYGWTNTDAPDEVRMKRINDEMSDIIYFVHGVRYISQKSIGLYPTTGSADDWFYGEDASTTNQGYRAPGLTIELRDTGRYGFILPPDQIIPTGEEVIEGALYFAEQYAENPLTYPPAPPPPQKGH